MIYIELRSLLTREESFYYTEPSVGVIFSLYLWALFPFVLFALLCRTFFIFSTSSTSCGIWIKIIFHVCSFDYFFFLFVDYFFIISWIFIPYFYSLFYDTISAVDILIYIICIIFRFNVFIFIFLLLYLVFLFTVVILYFMEILCHPFILL